MPPRVPDLALLEGVVATRILDAMRLASETLTKLRVRHALVGALAVGAWGHPRATKDVDFLVGDEAFEFHDGGIVTMRTPIEAGGVHVDSLSIAGGERHLESLLEKPIECGGIPVAPIEAIIYLKLKSPRQKDAADVVELLKVGLDPAAPRRYLETNAPDLVSKFDALARKAQEELA